LCTDNFMTGEPSIATASKKTKGKASYINYRLKSKVSVILHFQLCSIHYTAAQMQQFQLFYCDLMLRTTSACCHALLQLVSGIFINLLMAPILDENLMD